MEQLSSVVVHYLSQGLSALFEGDFSERNVSLELSSGSFTLRDVQLKEQFFNDLPVSLILTHGSIGKLHIAVPWKSLGSAPICVHLEEVNVLLRSSFVKDTASTAARKAHRLKLAKVASIESLCKIKGKSTSHSSAANFVYHYLKEKLASIIINTLEVSVHNVHIRFEDQVSCKEILGGVSLGIVLESMEWRPSRGQGKDKTPLCRCHDRGGCDQCGSNDAEKGHGDGILNMQVIRDLFKSPHTLLQHCEISGFAVYCNELHVSSKNACCVPFVGSGDKDIGRLMRSTAARNWRVSGLLSTGHTYVIHPHEYSLTLGVNFSKSSGDVHIGVQVLSKMISCDVEDNQLKNLANFSRFTDVYLAANNFSQFRPDAAAANTGKGPACERRDPVALWKFAILSVRHQLGHSAHLRLSPISVNRHFRDKLVYTELWKSILVNGCLASAVKEHSTQAFSQHSVNFVYNQLLALSRHRRCLRSGGNVDTDDFDLSYRQFTPVTDALLLQLEKRLTFESILIFRALAAVELEKDRKFNDPSWFKHFLYDAAKGLIQSGSDGESNARAGDAKKHLSFVLDLLSTSGSKKTGTANPPGKPETPLSLSRLRVSLHVGVEAVNLNLKLSPPSSIDRFRSATSSSQHAFPFFSINCRRLHVRAEADDQGKGIGSVPAVTSEVSLDDSTVVHRSPTSQGDIQQGSKNCGEGHQCHLVVARHPSPSGVYPPCPAATHLPFVSSIDPVVNSTPHVDKPLFVFSVECRPVVKHRGGGQTGGISIEIGLKTTAIDVFITPTSNSMMHAMNVFVSSLVLSEEDVTRVGTPSKDMSPTEKCRQRLDGDFPSHDIKGDLDHLSQSIGSILKFDTEIGFFADFQLATVNWVITSVPVIIENGMSHYHQDYFCWGTGNDETLNAREGNSCRPPLKLVLSSGHVSASVGEKYRKSTLNFELYDIQVSEVQAFVFACTCTSEMGANCSCRQSPIGGGAQSILSPLNVSLQAQLQDKNMDDFKTRESIRTSTSLFSQRLSDVAITLSYQQMEAVCHILECIIASSSKQSSYFANDEARPNAGFEVNKIISSEIERHGSLLGVVEDDEFFDVVETLRPSDIDNAKGCVGGVDDDDFYSLNSDSESDMEGYCGSPVVVSSQSQYDSQRFMLEDLRNDIMKKIEVYELEDVNLMAEWRLKEVGPANPSSSLIESNAITDEITRVGNLLRDLRGKYVDISMRLDKLENAHTEHQRGDKIPRTAIDQMHEVGGGYRNRERPESSPCSDNVPTAVTESYRQGLSTFVYSLGSQNSLASFSPQHKSSEIMKAELRFILNFRFIEKKNSRANDVSRKCRSKIWRLGGEPLISFSLKIPVVTVQVLNSVQGVDVPVCRLEWCKWDILCAHKCDRLKLSCVLNDFRVLDTIRDLNLDPVSIAIVKTDQTTMPQPPISYNRGGGYVHVNSGVDAKNNSNLNFSSMPSPRRKNSGSGIRSHPSRFLDATCEYVYNSNNIDDVNVRVSCKKLEVGNLREIFLKQCFSICYSLSTLSVFPILDNGVPADPIKKSTSTVFSPDKRDFAVNEYSSRHEVFIAGLSRFFSESKLSVSMMHEGIRVEIPLNAGLVHTRTGSSSRGLTYAGGDGEFKVEKHSLAFCVESVSFCLSTSSSHVLSCQGSLKNMSLSYFLNTVECDSPGLKKGPFETRLLYFEKDVDENVFHVSSTIFLVQRGNQDMCDGQAGGGSKYRLVVDNVVNANKLVVTLHLNILADIVRTLEKSIFMDWQARDDIGHGNGKEVRTPHHRCESTDKENMYSEDPITINLNRFIDLVVDISRVSFQFHIRGIIMKVSCENVHPCDELWDGGFSGSERKQSQSQQPAILCLSVDCGVERIRGTLRWGVLVPATENVPTSTQSYRGIEGTLTLEDAFVCISSADSNRASENVLARTSRSKYIVNPYQIFLSSAIAGNISDTEGWLFADATEMYFMNNYEPSNKEFVSLVTEQCKREVSPRSADFSVIVSPIVAEVDGVTMGFLGAFATSSTAICLQISKAVDILSQYPVNDTPDMRSPVDVDSDHIRNSKENFGIVVSDPLSIKVAFTLMELHLIACAAAVGGNGTPESGDYASRGAYNRIGKKLVESDGDVYLSEEICKDVDSTSSIQHSEYHQESKLEHPPVHLCLQGIVLLSQLCWLHDDEFNTSEKCYSDCDNDCDDVSLPSILMMSLQTSVKAFQCYCHHTTGGASGNEYSGKLLDTLLVASNDGCSSSGNHDDVVHISVVYRDNIATSELFVTRFVGVVNPTIIDSGVQQGVLMMDRFFTFYNYCSEDIAIVLPCVMGRDLSSHAHSVKNCNPCLRSFILPTASTLGLPFNLQSVTISIISTSCSLVVIDGDAVDMTSDLKSDSPRGFCLSGDFTVTACSDEEKYYACDVDVDRSKGEVVSTVFDFNLNECFIAPNLRFSCLPTGDQKASVHREQQPIVIGCKRTDIIRPFGGSVVHTVRIELDDIRGRYFSVSHQVDIAFEKKDIFIHLDIALYLAVAQRMSILMESITTTLTSGSPTLRKPTAAADCSDDTGNVSPLNNCGKATINTEFCTDHVNEEELDKQHIYGDGHLNDRPVVFFDDVEEVVVNNVFDALFHYKELCSSLSISVVDKGVSLTVINNLALSPFPLVRFDGPEVLIDFTASRTVPNSNFEELAHVLNRHEIEADLGLPVDIDFSQDSFIDKKQKPDFRIVNQWFNVKLIAEFLNISCHYYDSVLLDWKPFVHDFNCKVSGSSAWQMIGVPHLLLESSLPEVYQRPVYYDHLKQMCQLRHINDEDDTIAVLDIDFREDVHICISHPLVLCINNFTAAMECFFSPTSDLIPFRTAPSAYEVINNSGVLLRATSFDGVHTLHLPSSAKCALPNVYRGKIILSVGKPSELEGVTDIETTYHYVDLTKEDVCFYAAHLDSIGTAVAGDCYLLSVHTYLDVSTGSRICEIRSSLALKNSCPFPSKVNLLKGSEGLMSTEVQPGEIYFVPADKCSGDTLFTVEIVHPTPYKGKGEFLQNNIFSIDCPRSSSQSVDSSRRSYWLKSDELLAPAKTVRNRATYCPHLHVSVLSDSCGERMAGLPPTSAGCTPLPIGRDITAVNVAQPLYMHMRTIEFSPPFSISNSLPKSIDILVVLGHYSTFKKFILSRIGENTGNVVVYSLLSGDSVTCCEFPCDEAVTLFTRIHSTCDEISFPFHDDVDDSEKRESRTGRLPTSLDPEYGSWSRKGIYIRGVALACGEDDGKSSMTKTETIYASCESDNTAELSVSVDVTSLDGGRRLVSIYVPFWLVTYSSAVSLYYQINPIDDSRSDATLNGIDDLCADQLFSPNIVCDNDMQTVSSRVDSCDTVRPSWHISASLIEEIHTMTALAEDSNNNPCAESVSLSEVDRKYVMDEPPFQIMMCGLYTTTHQSEKCSLRLRIDDFPWSGAFDLTASGQQYVSARSSSCKGVDVGNTVSSRMFGGSDATSNPFGSPATHDQTTDFVIKPCSLEHMAHMFPKTKVFVVMEAFSVTNACDCVMRIRQYSCPNSVVTALPGERVTLPWRDHKLRCLQVQLVGPSVPGGSGVWSGKVVLNERSLFQLKMCKDDPKVVFMECVVRSAGNFENHMLFRSVPDGFAMMRVENTSTTCLVMCQVGVDDSFDICPGTAIPYAWDDCTLTHALSFHKLSSDFDAKIAVALVSIDDMTARLLDNGASHIGVELYFCGPVKVIRFFDRLRPAVSLLSESMISVAKEIAPRVLTRMPSSSLCLRRDSSLVSVKNPFLLSNDKAGLSTRAREAAGSVFGVPFFFSLHCAGVRIEIFDQSMNHSVELKAENICTTLGDDMNSILKIGANIGNIWVTCHGKNVGSAHQYPLFIGRCNLQRNITGAMAEIFDYAASTDTLNPSPFASLQIERNLSCVSGLLHLSSVALNLSDSSLLNINETSFVTLAQVARTTLQDVHIGAAEDVITRHVGTWKAMSALGRRGGSSTQLLMFHHPWMLNPSSLNVYAALSRTLTESISVVSKSHLACGNSNLEPNCFLENFSVSATIVQLCANVETYPPVDTRMAVSGGRSTLNKFLFPFESIFRDIISAILDQFSLTLRTPSLSLLKGSQGGAIGRPNDVVSVVLKEVFYAFVRDLVFSVISPARIVPTVIYFSYSFGRMILRTCVPVVESLVGGVWRAILSLFGVGIHSAKSKFVYTCKQITPSKSAPSDQLALSSSKKAYFFSLCWKETVPTYIFANDEKIIIGVCDSQFNIVSHHQVLMCNVRKVSAFPLSTMPHIVQEIDLTIAFDGNNREGIFEADELNLRKREELSLYGVIVVLKGVDNTTFRFDFTKGRGSAFTDFVSKNVS